MPVYMVIDIEITDRDTYEEYVARVPATVRKYGGQYLARGGTVTVLSGDWRPERIVLLEFPSEDRLRAWLSSPEYISLAPIRQEGANAKAIVVEGVADVDGTPG